jgi:hypothetical protein
MITDSNRDITEVSGVVINWLKFAGTVEESDPYFLHEPLL